MTKNKKILKGYEIVHKNKYGVKELDLSTTDRVCKIFYNNIIAVELTSTTILVRPVIYDEYDNNYYMVNNDELIIFGCEVTECDSLDNICKYIAQYSVSLEEDYCFRHRLLVWLFADRPQLYMDRDNYDFYVDRNDIKNSIGPILTYGGLDTKDLDMEGL